MAGGRLADRGRGSSSCCAARHVLGGAEAPPGRARLPGPADTGPPGLTRWSTSCSGLHTLPVPGGGRGLAVRYRRATPETCAIRSSGFAYAGLLTAVALLICRLVLQATRWAPSSRWARSIPVAAGIAIFKYRLYDIDVVISKTIVYGSLAAFITVVYVVIVVGIGSLDPVSCRPGRGRIWACRSWRPRWWRWPSSRSGNGCSGWPTGWCSASGPPPTRRSATSPGGWAGPTPPTTSCPGWPGSWPKAPEPTARWCG